MIDIYSIPNDRKDVDFGDLPMAAESTISHQWWPLVVIDDGYRSVSYISLVPLATIEPWTVSAANGASGTIGRANVANGTIGRVSGTIGRIIDQWTTYKTIVDTYAQMLFLSLESCSFSHLISSLCVYSPRLNSSVFDAILYARHFPALVILPTV